MGQFHEATDLAIAVASGAGCVRDVGPVFGEAALVIPGRARLLTSWIISIAKDLRDKLANNKQWSQARSLEERCKLFGLAFDPLPKQPFE